MGAGHASDDTVGECQKCSLSLSLSLSLSRARARARARLSRLSRLLVTCQPCRLQVTGNAAPFSLRPQFKDIFDKALLKASQATNAWITTGGMDAGVMRLVGQAMRTATTPVVGVSAWGVIKGRRRLQRPSVEKLAERIRNKHQAARPESQKAPEKVPTHHTVTQEFNKNGAKGWADPELVPGDIGCRLTFLSGRGKTSTLADIDLVAPGDGGRPNITRLANAEFATGKLGRGILGRWGPNQALDTIVTRKLPHDGNSSDGENALQVGLMYREQEGCWAIPGKFTSNEDIEILKTFATGSQLLGALPQRDSTSSADLARLVVRQIFELEGVPAGKAEQFAEIFDEIFKRSAQTLVYRGYSSDPRNTDEAWVETSVWHVHCPTELAGELSLGYAEAENSVQWMNIRVIMDENPRLEFYDSRGKTHELFASHHELIEMAVFGHVLGTPDLCVQHLCLCILNRHCG